MCPVPPLAVKLWLMIGPKEKLHRPESDDQVLVLDRDRSGERGEDQRREPVGEREDRPGDPHHGKQRPVRSPPPPPVAARADDDGGEREPAEERREDPPDLGARVARLRER